MTIDNSNLKFKPPDKGSRNLHHSTFGKIIAIYSRSLISGTLYSMEHKRESDIEDNWEEFFELYSNLRGIPSTVTQKVTEYYISAELGDRYVSGLTTPIKISEYQKEGEFQMRGCISTIEDESYFNDWFVFHVLDQCRIQNNCALRIEPKVPYHEIFTRYFEEELRNSVIHDEWGARGRQYFVERVRYYTDRYKRIECILPAFPCKSSNMNKVNDTAPDKGEELALRRLIKATEDVACFYPPGMKVWIVSDGHVFSDCIGVDDDVVSNYTRQLHDLYKNVANPGKDSIGFCGLKELLFQGKASLVFKSEWVEDFQIDHYTGTRICPHSDLCRQILMRSCDTDAGLLKEQISTPGHPRLYLYRGFSKFMMEDLSLLPYFENMSRKGFKKIISKIAFNMIKRNDAYSNLVELVFPHHLRISIHAHTNSGPKFGIKVISPKICKTTRTLNIDEEPKFEDLLHIPTPWHNCVVKIEGDNPKNAKYYLVKSKTVRDALESGEFVGYWKESNIELGEGGHYVIRRASC